jgi:endonuclease YncB( thermonuclease family)
MRYLSIALVVVLLVAEAGRDDLQERSKSEEHVIGLLRDAEPLIFRDESLPGKPVIAVRFRPNFGTVTDQDVVHLRAFSQLRVLELANKRLVTDAGLDQLAWLGGIEEISLNSTSVTPAGVIRFAAAHPKLKRLDLTGIPLRDDDVRRLAHLSELTTLSLRETLITDDGAGVLESFPSLRSLRLMSTRVGDAGLVHLRGLVQLEDLDLDRTAITNAGLDHLAALPRLRRLQIANTAVNDSGIERLAALASLESLNARGARITAAGLQKLQALRPLLNRDQTPVERQELGGTAHHPDENIQRITGPVQVLDAHTLKFADGTEVELNGGMDAPDLDEKGLIGDAFYPCGKDAAEYLRQLIGSAHVSCYAEGRRRGKVRGDCFVGERCLDIEMVRAGWAVSSHSGMEAWELIARNDQRGLWRGRFVTPSDWRKGTRLPGEDEAIISPRVGQPAAPGSEPPQTDRSASDPAPILGEWKSVDRHVAIGSLFQPVHGVRKRESMVYFEQTATGLTGHAIDPDHDAISFQERWKEGRTDFRQVQFSNGRLTIEFDIAEWRRGAGPLAVEDGSLRNEGTIRIEAKLREDRLSGRWMMYTGDGSEVFRGEWEAKRPRP